MRLALGTALAALIFTSCTPLPPLPDVRTEGFPPAIEAQIQAALQPARLSPKNAAAVARLCRVLLAYDLDESALACFERAHALDRSTFRWPYYEGVIHQGRNDHEQAVEALRTTIERSPQDAPTRLRLADSLRALDRNKEAIEIYESLLAATPNSARAHFGLARAMLALSRTSDAITHLERAIRLFPRYRDARAALVEALRHNKDDAGWRTHAAFLAADPGGEPPTADPLMDQVRQLDQSPRARTATGVSLLEAGLPRAALKEFEAALVLDPRDLDAHVHSIAAYQDLRDFSRAQQHYRTAVGISPDEPRSYYEFGKALFGQQRYEDAVEALRAAVARDPANASTWTLLGDSLLAVRRNNDANRAYRRALAINPDLATAHRGTGLIQLGLGRYDGAIEHLVRAQDLPGAAALPALEALAAAYDAKGDSTKALDYLQKARTVSALHGSAQKTADLSRTIRERQ